MDPSLPQSQSEPRFYQGEVDYSVGVACAINACNFYTSYVYSGCEIPVGGTGKMVRQVVPRHLDREMSTQEVWNMIGRGNFADPLTALAIAQHLPEEQSKSEMVTLWEDRTGKICYMILHGDQFGRDLTVWWDDCLDIVWKPGCRFLECRSLPAVRV
jgi:hypothetical protein